MQKITQEVLHITLQYYFLAIYNHLIPVNLDNELVKLAADHGNLEMVEYLFKQTEQSGEWGKIIFYSML